MAPRHVPRRFRNYDTDAQAKSRYNGYVREALEMDSDVSNIEVPYYMVAPRARSKREMMKRASVLKSGTTGYGCPVGFSGSITYPLTDKEKELLNSLGAGAAAPVGAGAAAPVGAGAAAPPGAAAAPAGGVGIQN